MDSDKQPSKPDASEPETEGNQSDFFQRQWKHVDDIPWHLGVYDAHCHPTDTLDGLPSIPKMRARVLTVMATRKQDQELVSQAYQANGLDVASLDVASPGSSPCQILPAFGWHPWFSYQLFDDTDDATTNSSAATPSRSPPPPPPPSKAEHYRAVLTPAPDAAFTEGLPEPRSLAAYIRETRAYLEAHPLALVGEVGLDRSIRLPENTTEGRAASPEPGLTPGGRECRRLSVYRVDVEHQRKVLLAQLRLAAELGRAVSVHGVAAHGVLFDTLQSLWRGHERKVRGKRARARLAEAAKRQREQEQEQERDQRQQKGQQEGQYEKQQEGQEQQKVPDTGSEETSGGGGGGAGEEGEKGAVPKPYPPRICLHSYSGPPEVLKRYMDPAVPVDVYVSFSFAINFAFGMDHPFHKAWDAVRAVPDDRLLVESDLHRAGGTMDGVLSEVIHGICEDRGWDLETGVRQLGSNWKAFALGVNS